MVKLEIYFSCAYVILIITKEFYQNLTSIKLIMIKLEKILKLAASKDIDLILTSRGNGV